MDAAMALLIVEQSPDALVVLDASGVVVSWNRAAEAIFGLTSTQALGQALSALVGTAATDDADMQSTTGTSALQRELICRRADGSLICVRRTLRAQFDELGRLQRWFCALADITAAHVAQDRDFVRARFQGLLESVPDAVVIVNDSGRIVLFNAQATAMFGHAQEAAIGQPIELLLPVAMRDQHVPQRSAYLGAPRLRPMGRGLDLRGRRADGSEFPVEISLSPIDGEGHRLVMSSIRDTTDRKRIEQALQDKNVELERANRAKDHFLATMSHELRTPLNAILGFAGLLLMKLPGPLNEVQERQLQHVQTSGRHLLSLINDLLDLAKIESGHVELLCEWLDCRPLIDEVANVLRQAASEKHLALDVDLPPGPMTVRADRRALRQVLLNLASNAIKFTAQGSVRVWAEARGDAEQPQWVLAVVDSGVGMSAADLQRLFQAFVQVGERRHGEGTGLGLYLSHKLAQLMGGRLDVASELGQGSTFTLTLARLENR
jgi:protein-histidine pros-kinase